MSRHPLSSTDTKVYMRQIACAVIAFVLAAAGAAPAQEKTVPLPPGVKVEGMPPIPQSIADGLAQYAQFRMAQMQAWHPVKRQVLVNTTFATPQLHVLDGPGRDRRQLTWMPGGVSVRNAYPAFDPADPNTFVFLYDPSGGESRSLYRFDMTTGQVSLVVEAQSRYGLAWARQGKWVAYDSAERNGKDRDLYVVQPADPKTKRRLAEFEGPFSPHDWSPDGAMLVANEIVSNSETYLWVIDVKTGEKSAITPRDGEKAGFYFPRFSADGKKVYAMSDREGGVWRAWRCDVAKCVWSAVTPAGTALDSPTGTGAMELSSDGTLLATIVDRGTSTELLIMDLSTLKPRSLPAMPRGVVSNLHWRPASKELGFTHGSVKAQADAYSVDTSLGTLTRWTFSETTFNADALPVPDLVEWKSSDGVTISGILYHPAARFTGPRPVLVQLHGGPDQREMAVFRGRSNYFLNELGVALIYPNVRGSSGFGREFAEMDNGGKRDGAIKDVGGLLDWIATRPDLDATRVVLAGPSYGGWLALEA